MSTASSELSEGMVTGRPYVIVRTGSDQSQNNIVAEGIGAYWVFGRVAFNRFVIVSGSPSGPSVRLGTKEDAMKDGVLSFEECVYASNMGMRARVERIDIVEDNWRAFLGGDIVDGSGNILDIDKLWFTFPRLKQQFDVVKGFSSGTHSREFGAGMAEGSPVSTFKFPLRGTSKGGTVELPFTPAPVEDESSQSEDKN